MDLAALLLEIRRRARVLPSPRGDPLQEILNRIGKAPQTTENRTLLRVAVAISSQKGDFGENEIWALGNETLALLDALIAQRIR
jgi:hypothetical protein